MYLQLFERYRGSCRLQRLQLFILHDGNQPAELVCFQIQNGDIVYRFLLEEIMSSLSNAVSAEITILLNFGFGRALIRKVETLTFGVT